MSLDVGTFDWKLQNEVVGTTIWIMIDFNAPLPKLSTRLCSFNDNFLINHAKVPLAASCHGAFTSSFVPSAYYSNGFNSMKLGNFDSNSEMPLSFSSFIEVESVMTSFYFFMSSFHSTLPGQRAWYEKRNVGQNVHNCAEKFWKDLTLFREFFHPLKSVKNV